MTICSSRVLFEYIHVACHYIDARREERAKWQSVVAEKDAALTEKDAVLMEKTAALEGQAARIAELEALLENNNQ